MPKSRFEPHPGLLYHPNVAAILRNSAGEILICERVDNPGAWQFPQGGIDAGESPEQALRREVWEEIGLQEGYTIVEHRGPYRYLYGDGQKKRGFHGKEQEYFLLEFTGDPATINLETEHPEFRASRWILPSDFRLEWLPQMKKEVYTAVLQDFFQIELPPLS